MASYSELFDLITGNVAGAADLRNKVGIATLISADKVRSGDDDVPPFDQAAGKHDDRVVWAAGVFRSPRGMAKEVFGAVLAANSGATSSQIVNASDAAIQTAVDAVVDVMATPLPVSP